MNKFLLCLTLIILLIAASSSKAAAFHSRVIAQVIISTGQDSARSTVTDSIAATAPKGDDYSKYAPDEKSGRMWRWMIAIDLAILLLILFAIVRSRRKKK